MLVSDGSELPSLITPFFQAQGHQVTTCADVATAWQHYLQQLYAIVFIDSTISPRHTLKLSRQIRSLPPEDTTLIIVFTAIENHDQLQTILEAGADDYILQTVSPQELNLRLQVIARQLRHRFPLQKIVPELAEDNHDQSWETGENQQQYIVINSQFQIVSTSSGIAQFAEQPEAVNPEQDVREALPELIGTEAQILAILAGEEEYFSLPSIARSRQTNHPFYFDLSISKYHADNFKSPNLIILLNNSTPRMIFQQQLIQVANESQLLLREIRIKNQYIEQINADLQKRSLELESANQELEAFSHTVSHDLRNPINKIKMITYLLQEEYGEQLDEEARTYFSYIDASCDQMVQLIRDLLQLSRLRYHRLDIKPVNLSLLVKTIAKELQELEQQRQVEWNITPDVVVNGDAKVLRVALKNLLGNAWKYTSKKEIARIEFGVNSTGEQSVYFIRDNGAGFNMKYVDKLFTAFQRLHSQQEFEGSGIGLNTVKRIIERHNGRVWAEGAVDRGATFYFTLSC